MLAKWYQVLIRAFLFDSVGLANHSIKYHFPMMTSSNGNIFRVTGHFCGEFTGPGEFPTQRPVTRSFDVYFDLRPNKRLSKQSLGWWFETLSPPLWRHRNALMFFSFARYNYRLVLGADNGTTYNELFKYNSIGTPILPLVGQRSEVGRFNAGKAINFLVSSRIRGMPSQITSNSSVCSTVEASSEGNVTVMIRTKPHLQTLLVSRPTVHSLLWRHNDHDGISNHQPHGCLLNRLFRRRSKKTSKLRVTGLCVGNSPGPVNSPHKGPVTRKMFPFDDVIM